MKRILITGGNGYIGARLSYELSNLGHQVSLLCYPNIPDDQNWLDVMDSVFVGDITESEVVNSLTDSNYDLLIHLVSLDQYQSDANPVLVNNVNVLPLWNLLHSFNTKGNLSRCIYMSTVQVYGQILGRLVTEETPILPVNSYALTHKLCEDICNYFNQISPIECISLRLSNSYGQPVLKNTSCWGLVVNDLCRQAYINNKIVVLSDGTPERDFIHFSDIVKAFKLLIDSNELPYKTFNLCSGKTYTIFELARIISEGYNLKYNKDIRVHINSQAKKVSTDTVVHQKTVWSNQRLMDLGYISSMSLFNGIVSLFDYFDSV